VTDLDNAVGRDGRERVTFPAIQLVGPLPLADDLALGPARQIQVAHERTAVVVSLARAFAATARSVAAIAGVVTVNWIAVPRVVSLKHLTKVVAEVKR
jgi:hypothetical protein